MTTKRKINIKSLVAFAAIALLISLFVACEGGNAPGSVNELLYPHLRVTDDGEIYVKSGFNADKVTIPDNLETKSGNKATIFAGYENESDKNSLKNLVLEDGITQIGEEALKDAGNLGKVTLPDSLTDIGSGAFENSGLQSVEIPESVENIGNNAFGGDKLTSAKIPASMTQQKGTSSDIFGSNLQDVAITGKGNIGNGFFRGQANLGKVTLPDGIKEIGENAFNGTGLGEINFPEGLEVIGNGAFANTTGDSNFVIPSSVKNVATGAFDTDDIVSLTYKITSSKDESLSKELIVKYSPEKGNLKPDDIINALGVSEEGTLKPESIIDSTGTVLSEMLPDNKWNIDSIEVKLPNGNPNHIKVNFADPNLEYIPHPDKYNPEYYTVKLSQPNENPSKVEISGSYRGKPVKGIEENGFKDAENLKEVVIGEGVENIGKGAFENLSNLSDVKLPESIKEIGANAFKNNTAITEDILAKLPNVETVGEYAFSGTGMTEATIPNKDTFTAIPDGMFMDSKNLCTLKPGKDNNESISKITSFGNEAFKGTALDFGNLTFNKDTTNIGDGSFVGTEIDSLDFSNIGKDSRLEYGKGAFSNVQPLTEVKLPENLTKDNIDDFVYAFVDSLDKSVDSVTSITVPAELTKDKDVMDKISKLFPNVTTAVVTGTDVSKEIGDESFIGFGKLEEVEIQEPIESIGTGAFEGLGNLTTLLPDDKLPESLKSIGNNAFKDTGLGKDKAPGYAGTYNKETGEWTDGFLPEELTNIGAGAFENTYIGSDIRIPDEVTFIGQGAFAGIKPVEDGKNVGTIQLPSTALGSVSDILTGTGTTTPVKADKVIITGTPSGDLKPIVGTTEPPTDDIKLVVDEIVIGTGVTGIDGDDFIGIGVDKPNETLKITLPENIDSIGGSFTGLPKTVDPNGGNKGVGTIWFEPNGILPGGIKVEEGAFSGNSGYPNKENGGDPFSTKDPITGEILISDVKEIGKGAFTGNQNITKVTIPAGCTYIGADAFKGCTNLTEIIFELPRKANLTINTGAFADSGLTSIKLPETGDYTISIYSNAFNTITENIEIPYNSNVSIAKDSFGTNAKLSIGVMYTELSNSPVEKILTISQDADDAVVATVIEALVEEAIKDYIWTINNKELGITAKPEVSLAELLATNNRTAVYAKIVAINIGGTIIKASPETTLAEALQEAHNANNFGTGVKFFEKEDDNFGYSEALEELSNKTLDYLQDKTINAYYQVQAIDNDNHVDDVNRYYKHNTQFVPESLSGGIEKENKRYYGEWKDGASSVGTEITVNKAINITASWDKNRTEMKVLVSGQTEPVWIKDGSTIADLKKKQGISDTNISLSADSTNTVANILDSTKLVVGQPYNTYYKIASYKDFNGNSASATLWIKKGVSLGTAYSVTANDPSWAIVEDSNNTIASTTTLAENTAGKAYTKKAKVTLTNNTDTTNTINKVYYVTSSDTVAAIGTGNTGTSKIGYISEGYWSLDKSTPVTGNFTSNHAGKTFVYSNYAKVNTVTVNYNGLAEAVTPDSVYLPDQKVEEPTREYYLVKDATAKKYVKVDGNVSQNNVTVGSLNVNTLVTEYKNSYPNVKPIDGIYLVAYKYGSNSMVLANADNATYNVNFTGKDTVAWSDSITTETLNLYFAIKIGFTTASSFATYNGSPNNNISIFLAESVSAENGGPIKISTFVLSNAFLWRENGSFIITDNANKNTGNKFFKTQGKTTTFGVNLYGAKPTNENSDKTFFDYENIANYRMEIPDISSSNLTTKQYINFLRLLQAPAISQQIDPNAEQYRLLIKTYPVNGRFLFHAE